MADMRCTALRFPTPIATDLLPKTLMTLSCKTKNPEVKKTSGTRASAAPGHQPGAPRAKLDHGTDLVTFSHPDYTVGPGLSPDPPLTLASHR
jgi:hypothetical protein